MGNSKPDARYGEEQEQGIRRLARLKAAIAKVQAAHPKAKAALDTLWREMQR